MQDARRAHHTQRDLVGGVGGIGAVLPVKREIPLAVRRE
jgi:hypothetical protein